MGRSHVVVFGYRSVDFIVNEDLARWEMRIRRSVFAGGGPFRGFLVVVSLQLKSGNSVRIAVARDTHALLNHWDHLPSGFLPAAISAPPHLQRYQAFTFRM